MTFDPSVVDEGRFAVRRTIRIAAPIEKVWSAVTDPALGYLKKLWLAKAAS